MQESGVYQIMNLHTGRSYIGSSVNITNRLAHHLNALKRGNHHCAYLQRSFNKWGEDAFSFNAIEYVNDTATLIEREQFYIDSIGINALFNTTPTAGSPLGVKRTAETRARVSAARKGKGIGNKNALGSKASDELRAKRSANQLGYQWSEEARRKLSISKTGTRHTEETLEKLKGRVVSDETRAKLSAARLGSKVSQETIAKRTATAKERGSVFRKAVCQVDAQTGEVILIFRSLTAASQQTSTNLSCISEVCHGKQKTAGGYGWRFL